MAFSGALTLTDLNDFITPSQACIKPVEEVKSTADFKEMGAASTQIQVDASGAYFEVPNHPSADGRPSGSTGRKLETAQISLNDCLACSGCITSAESVLITMQSHEEVFKVLSCNPPPSSDEHRIPVLSISPQSLASLAASLSSSSTAPVTLLQVLSRVQTFCTQELGFEHVYDTTFARHIALLEHKQEFQERLSDGKRSSPEATLPMLASACPGWICYAEKAHSEMLPFISCTKSPQQVMGTLVKSWLGQKWSKKPSDIYHVTVMPCYDKKLEASRQDFYNEIYSTRDVDCVITTGELSQMMHDRDWDLSMPVPNEDCPTPSSQQDMPNLLSHPGSSSGSYLQSLISDYLRANTELTTRVVRNADYEEHIITNTVTGSIEFKGAKCYGFRNLQNLVRKVGKESGVQVGKGAAGRLAVSRAKRSVLGQPGPTDKDRGYDYVEVMACPSGCINGGGQIKPAIPQIEAEHAISGDSATGLESATAGSRWGDKEWTKKVEQAYWHELPTPPASPAPRDLKEGNGGKCPLVNADALAQLVLADLCGGDDQVNSMGRRRALFRTQYRAVESDIVGLQVKW